MTANRLPASHPERESLHNEIHAQPPEPMAAAHMVMVCDAAERKASREHLTRRRA
jgi:hypothetical protein